MWRPKSPARRPTRSRKRRSPLLGEHTEEILKKVIGYSEKEVAEIKTSGAITAPEKPAKAA